MKHITTMQELNNNIINLLQKYEYDEGLAYEPTEYGVGQMLDKWFTQKNEIISAMEKDPNYNGNYQVVLSNDYGREIDTAEVRIFTDWVGDRMIDQIKGQKAEDHYGDEYTIDEYRYPRHMEYEGRPYGTKCNRALSCLAHQYLEGSELEYLNEAFPFLKAHNGAKTSKVVRRICKEYGIDQLPDFNSRYTKFADAINPLKVTRWTILSVNPIDYLMMSYGNSWTSCHFIDKTTKEGIYAGQYHGCYSGGTLSYMLDPSSIVVYVIDESYKGNNPETQPKILRQMFHIGEDKIIQGRLYPQDNDSGSSETYKQLREIVQRVVSRWFGWDNLWTNVKGTEECGKVICSEGNHYRDYYHYGNCNVSYRAGGREKNFISITVGSVGICPTCGGEVDEEEYIVCGDCRRNGCERCGERIDPDCEIITADGHHYCCESCAENDDYVYCYNAGEWRSAHDSDVMYDDYLDEWMYDFSGYWGDAIHTEDGHNYCNAENAIDAGYLETSSGEWYPEDEVYYCEKRDEYVHYSECDDERDCCECCAEREEETA